MRRRTPRLTVAGALAALILVPTTAAAFPIPVPTPRSDPAAAETPVALPDLAPALSAAIDPAAAAQDLPAPEATHTGPRIVKAAKRLYCVEFARALSGIEIRGNAATWWNKAKGLYARLTSPEPGAVMVFASSRRMRAGHVAVVKDIVSNREVRVDHANWGNDGRIYLNAPVIDVSKRNDWSEVRVWNTKLGQLGTRVYRIRGFVGS